MHMVHTVMRRIRVVVVLDELVECLCYNTVYLTYFVLYNRENGYGTFFSYFSFDKFCVYENDLLYTKKACPPSQQSDEEQTFVSTYLFYDIFCYSCIKFRFDFFTWLWSNLTEDDDRKHRQEESWNDFI
jgi:hypothetical protein